MGTDSFSLAALDSSLEEGAFRAFYDFLQNSPIRFQISIVHARTVLQYLYHKLFQYIF